MTEEVFRWNHCEKKKKYTSIKMATKRIKQIKKRGNICDGLNVYLCKYCGFYHIGHKAKERAGK